MRLKNSVNSNSLRSERISLDKQEWKCLFVGVILLQGPKQEALDQNWWWDRLEQLKTRTDRQEEVIKTNYGREGAQILESMAADLGLHL
jgi:hypothetical protein